MDSIPDNIEDLYVDNDNMETFNKYVQDAGFLFNDITENIIGPLEKTPIVSFDSNYNNIEMSITMIDDEYMSVDYEHKEIIEKIKGRVIFDFIDDPNRHSVILTNIFASVDSSQLIYKHRIKCQICGDMQTDSNDPTFSHCPNDKTHKISECIVEGMDIQKTEKNEDNKENKENEENIENKENKENNYNINENGDVIINIDDEMCQEIEPDKTNEFFDCFNEENSVNNVIVCNTIHNKKNNQNIYELTTSYMFENEDLRKNDIYPFANGTYNYKKTDKPKGWLESLGMITTSAMMIFGNN
jgi:hypothetical protein